MPYMISYNQEPIYVLEGMTYQQACDALYAHAKNVSGKDYYLVHTHNDNVYGHIYFPSSHRPSTMDRWLYSQYEKHDGIMKLKDE